MKPIEAKKIIARATGDRYKLTARKISFQDLARADAVFVKIHGWKPSPEWDSLKALAKTNGFFIETDGLFG